MRRAVSKFNSVERIENEETIFRKVPTESWLNKDVSQIFRRFRRQTDEEYSIRVNCSNGVTGDEKYALRDSWTDLRIISTIKSCLTAYYFLVVLR